MTQVQLSDPGNDFIREIRPTKKQEDLLALPDEIFEVLFGGAAYGGKSFILTLLPIIRGWYKFSGFKGLILRRKFPDLERENIRLSKDYYPATGATYNEMKHSWLWREYNSYMDFGHIQHDSDVSQYDSSQYNYVFYDELTHFGAHSYFYLVGSRVRPSSSFNVALVRSGSNPGGIGQTWVYDRFVRPCEEGYKILKDTNTGLLRTFIPAFIEDNPYGQEYDPQYAEKLKLLPESEYKAKRWGDWHAFKGSVFQTFRPMRFPGEPANALHVIPSFSIPQWWPRIISIDWGRRAMCYCCWLAISPNRRVYIYRERSWYNRDISFWANEIKLINDDNDESFVQTTLCGSAWQNRGGELIADEFQRYSNLVPSSSENTAGSRIAGLQLIHDFLRWEKIRPLLSKGEYYDLKHAQEIYRNYGPKALEGYKKQFYDEPEEENLPVLQIFESCKVLINTIPLAIYDEKKVEDIAEFEGDDPLDCLRYACKTAKRFLTGEIGNLSLVEKKQEVLSDYEIDNDTTRMYRRLEAIEMHDQHTLNDCIPISRRSRFARMRTH
jgi:hypothetical protein